MERTLASPRSALRPSTATLAPAAAQAFRHCATEHTGGAENYGNLFVQVK